MRQITEIHNQAFFCGTASEVTPISIVDGRTINNGKPLKMLQSFYLDIIHGKITAYNHWLSFIPHYKNNLNTPNYN